QGREPTGGYCARVAGDDQHPRVMCIKLQVVPPHFSTSRRNQIGKGPRAERKQALVRGKCWGFTTGADRRGPPDSDPERHAHEWVLLTCWSVPGVGQRWTGDLHAPCSALR